MFGGRGEADSVFSVRCKTESILGCINQEAKLGKLCAYVVRQKKPTMMLLETK